MKKMTRNLLIVSLSILLLTLMVSEAYAAGFIWSPATVNCTGGGPETAYGKGQLSWWGYWSWNWGSTQVWLYDWDGSNWTLESSAFESKSGGTASTYGFPYGYGYDKWWVAVARYKGSFMSTATSTSSSKFC
jgi:hypothetical protein